MTIRWISKTAAEIEAMSAANRASHATARKVALLDKEPSKPVELPQPRSCPPATPDLVKIPTKPATQKTTDWSKYLSLQLKAVGIAGFTREHKFHPIRRWRFDLANIACKLAVEVEGGVWVTGRHTRGAGFLADMEKYNNATLLGWRLIRVTPQQVESGAALNLIDSALDSL